MKHILVIIVAWGFMACSDFLNVNTDPNNPTEVPVEMLLGNALNKSNTMEVLGLSNGVGVLSNPLSLKASLNQMGSVWAGYWSKATNGPSTTSLFRLEETYNMGAIDDSYLGYPFWEDTYKIILNYRDIQTIASKDGDLTYVGIAKIMQAWHFMRLVDLYNNVPFADALQGTLNGTPNFESGEAVYKQSIDMITSGITDIKADGAFSKKPTTDDILFKGDPTRWIKLANTIKLRALLRQSQLNKTAYITSEIAIITAEGSGFIGVGEGAMLNPGYTAGTINKCNPQWERYYRNNQGALTADYNTLRPSELIIKTYQNLQDPRLALIYVPVDGAYVGVPLGSTSVNDVMLKTSAFRGPSENGNQPAGIFKSATQASVFLSSFESLFLQAEAAQRGWIAGSPEMFFNQAIEESFNYIGAKSVDTYLAQPAVSLGMAGHKIQRIIEQKWLALNSINGFEAWCDYRRLGIPALPQSLQSSNADVNYRPYRLGYRISELTKNRKNVEAQGVIDPFVSRVFWNY